MIGKIALIGLGNILLRDEGFGVHLVRKLKGYLWPPEVELIDGGCAGLNLIHFFREREIVFFIDVFLAEDPPGTLRWFSWEEIEALPPHLLVSGHQYGLKEALALARLLGQRPRLFRVLAAVPESLSPGLELSPTLQEALEQAEEILLEELKQLGLEVKPCV